MSIIGLIITLVVIGVILWLVNTYLPMDPKIKNILNIVVIIIVVLWLLSLFVNFGSLGTIGTRRIG